MILPHLSASNGDQTSGRVTAPPLVRAGDSCGEHLEKRNFQKRTKMADLFMVL
jgi:hypothetical protein